MITLPTASAQLLIEALNIAKAHYLADYETTHRSVSADKARRVAKIINRLKK